MILTQLCHLILLPKIKIKQMSTMIQQFKEAYKDSPQQLMKLLTNPTTVHGLGQKQLQYLAKFVEGNAGLQGRVMCTIYSILVMRRHNNYSQKQAIQRLSRHYKHLPNSKWSQKTKRVLAATLLRVPTFSNYSLIIQHICPSLVPLSLMLTHREKIIKQCPNLYQVHIIEKYKHIWIQLLNLQPNTYTIAKGMEGLREMLMKMGEVEDWYELTSWQEKIQAHFEYLLKKVGVMREEEIFIEDVTKNVDDILGMKVGENVLFREQRQKILERSQADLFVLVGKLWRKVGNRLLRKLAWVNQLFHKALLNPQPAQLTPIIYLITSIYLAHGEGALQIDTYFYSQPYSIHKLIEALLYNTYKQQTEQMNYQKGKKKSSTNQISIYRNNYIESHFQAYLEATTDHERNQILRECLLLLNEYFKKEKKIQKGSKFLIVLENSKNPISFENSLLVEKLKQTLFGEVKLQRNLLSFCEQVFEGYVKKRVKRQLAMHRCQQVMIKGQKKISSELRKTKSIEVFEGWSDSKHPMEKSSNSSMFHTIREMSQDMEHPHDKPSTKKEDIEQIHEQHAELIFTPQF